jgi:hypothetical protein
MLAQYDQAMRDRFAKHLNLERRYQRIFKADDTSEDDDRDDDNGNGNGDNERHIVDQLADLLVEAGSDGDGKLSREDALRYLLHSTRGQALVGRMAGAARKRATRKASTMTRSETLRRIVTKTGGLGPLCRKIVKRGSTEVSEAELTGMLISQAEATYPNMTSEAAFSKMFCGPDGLVWRQAIQIAKATQLEIMPVATEAGDTDVADDTQEATRQMERLVDEQIRRSPEMTRGAAWDVVVRDNPALAERALRQPSAKSYLAFPR